MNRFTKEVPVFKNGTYNKKCSLFSDISIGSVLCVGHPEINKIKPCKYCVSYEEKNTYYLPVLKETITIVSEVSCSRHVINQQKLF